MSQQLETAMQQVLKMRYFKTVTLSFKRMLLHTSKLWNILVQTGFREFSRENFPRLTKQIIKHWLATHQARDLRLVTETLPVGGFVLQPAGSQSCPDMLIRDFNDRYIALECKSSAQTCPMWNDNLPEEQTIYVFSSKATNQTTVFLGQWVITPQQKQIRLRITTQIKKLIQLEQSQCANLDEYDRGWDFNVRPQNFQKGGSEKTNYFPHADRLRCKNQVLEFAKQ